MHFSKILLAAAALSLTLTTSLAQNWTCSNLRKISIINSTGLQLSTHVHTQCACYSHEFTHPIPFSPSGKPVEGFMKADEAKNCQASDKFLSVTFFTPNGSKLGEYKYLYKYDKNKYPNCGKDCEFPFEKAEINNIKNFRFICRFIKSQSGDWNNGTVTVKLACDHAPIG